jgi:hypothetical protein
MQTLDAIYRVLLLLLLGSLLTVEIIRLKDERREARIAHDVWVEGGMLRLEKYP